LMILLQAECEDTGSVSSAKKREISKWAASRWFPVRYLNTQTEIWIRKLYWAVQHYTYILNILRVHLLLDQVAVGGLAVIVLAIGPKVWKFKPCRGLWIFNGDKNSQHDFFRGGSKVDGPMSKILRHVKDPYSREEIFVGKINGHLLSSISCFAARCLSLLVTAREFWWVNQELLELRWGSRIDQWWS
jgi:hypothetical protein